MLTESRGALLAWMVGGVSAGLFIGGLVVILKDAVRDAGPASLDWTIRAIGFVIVITVVVWALFAYALRRWPDELDFRSDIRAVFGSSERAARVAWRPLVSLMVAAVATAVVVGMLLSGIVTGILVIAAGAITRVALAVYAGLSTAASRDIPRR